MGVAILYKEAMIALHEQGAESIALHAKVLWLFWPYALLMAAAFISFMGTRAAEIRNRIVVFSGSVVLMCFLCTAWDLLTANAASAGLMTKPLMWWVVFILAALAGHCVIYMTSDIRSLPRNTRNRVGSVLASVAFLFGFLIGGVHAYKWIVPHNDEAAIEVFERERRAHEATDRLTAAWLEQNPEQWEFLLLRANTLHRHGWHAEARQLIEQLADSDDGEIPESLRLWLDRQLPRHGL